jgi:hypothetical protein
MALATPCLTPGAVYHTDITDDGNQTFVALEIELPRLDLTELQAAELEANLHNATELVLARYFQ